jgi:hypothetical protein
MVKWGFHIVIKKDLLQKKLIKKDFFPQNEFNATVFFCQKNANKIMNMLLINIKIFRQINKY